MINFTYSYGIGVLISREVVFQSMTIDINFIDFQIHFETHILSLRRIISQDIRLVKEMQDVLLSKMKNKNGLNSNACSTWMRLSAHKINLASKLKPPPRAIINTEKPYEFT